MVVLAIEAVILPLPEEQPEISLFKHSIVMQTLPKENLVIYFNNASKLQVSDSFEEMESNELNILVNQDVDPDFNLRKSRRGIVFLVILRNAQHNNFTHINLISKDVFLYVETDKHSLNERERICKSGALPARMALIYDPIPASVYACRFTYDGDFLFVDHIYRTEDLMLTWMTSQYTYHRGREFNVGYTNIPPFIYK